MEQGFSGLIPIILFILVILFLLFSYRAYKIGYKSGMVECLKCFANRDAFPIEKLENDIKSWQDMIDGNNSFWESEKEKHKGSIQFYDKEIASASSETEKNKLIESRNTNMKADEEFFAKREADNIKYVAEKEALERQLNEIINNSPEIYEKEQFLKEEYKKFFRRGLEKAFSEGNMPVEIYQDYLRKIKSNEEEVIGENNG